VDAPLPPIAPYKIGYTKLRRPTCFAAIYDNVPFILYDRCEEEEMREFLYQSQPGSLHSYEQKADEVLISLEPLPPDQRESGKLESTIDALKELGP
jgi:hypothetical protein